MDANRGTRDARAPLVWIVFIAAVPFGLRAEFTCRKPTRDHARFGLAGKLTLGRELPNAKGTTVQRE